VRIAQRDLCKAEANVNPEQQEERYPWHVGIRHKPGADFPSKFDERHGAGGE
jgi:hypothetical protein